MHGQYLSVRTWDSFEKSYGDADSGIATDDQVLAAIEHRVVTAPLPNEHRADDCRSLATQGQLFNTVGDERRDRAMAAIRGHEQIPFAPELVPVNDQ